MFSKRIRDKSVSQLLLSQTNLLKHTLSFRRFVRGISLLLVLLFSFVPSFSYAEKDSLSLYVSFPTNIPAIKLQSLIQEKCDEINVTVYQRIKDFNRALMKSPPDAIISLHSNAVLSDFKHQLQGYKSNNQYEQYVLITHKNNKNLRKTKGLKIAAVNFLGTPIDDFIKRKLNSDIEVIPLIKNNDLIPVLIFNQADAVLASKRTYKNQNKHSKVDLNYHEIDIDIKLVSVSISKTNNIKLLTECVNKFDKTINGYMGVDEWK